jgi:DNA-binding transcriptional regulator YhcF (GntR family)
MKELTKATIFFSAIKEKIIKSELVKGNRLPSVKKLALEFHVSEFTVIKAFELLEKEDLITRVKNSGVYIGIINKSDLIESDIKPSKTRAQEIADSIILQILNGVLKVGEYLTLKKVLIFKYTASKKTVKKAIDILVERKYIHKESFRYRIGRPVNISYRVLKNRVYVLTRQKLLGWRDVNLVLQALEIELQKHGVISLEYLNIENEQDLINKVKETATAGFYLNFRNLVKSGDSPETLQANFHKIIETVSKNKLPLVVDNSNIIFEYIPDFTFHPETNIFIIRHDDYLAGEKMGTFLASMGHKQIAYFNFVQSQQDIQRLKGVESALKLNFNTETNVYYFHEKSDDLLWTADLSTYANTSQERKDDFLKGYSRLFGDYQFQHTDLVKKAYPLLANLIFQDKIGKRTPPIFEKALGIKEITAWVGTGTYDTIAAIEFLTEKKIDFPDKISLAGFRDHDFTMGYGITAYNFMENNMGYLAAHCILGDIPIKKSRRGYMEYEGQMMVRKSVKAI